ncbi:hypothetical protein B7463_g2044, partial [Scytalidium lignicola]
MSHQQPIPAWIEEVRRNRCQALRELEKRLCEYQHVEVEEVDLINLGISVVEMHANAAVDSVPELFFRFPQNDLPPPDDDKVGEAYPVYTVPTTGLRPKRLDYIKKMRGYMASYGEVCFDDFKEKLQASTSKKEVNKWLRGTWGYGEVEDLEIPYSVVQFEPFFWMVTGTDELPDQQYPHLVCYMDLDFEGVAKLLREELLATVRMMLGRLESKRGEGHTVAPVCLLRIPFFLTMVLHTDVFARGATTRSHYASGLRRKGPSHLLHKLHDFTTKNYEGLEAFARIDICTVVGNTMTNKRR